MRQLPISANSGNGINPVINQPLPAFLTEAMRNYLLGKGTGAEREIFEKSLIVNNCFYEVLEVMESELIENYLEQTLSPEDTRHFEKMFFATGAGREKIKFTSNLKITAERLCRKYNSSKEN